MPHSPGAVAALPVGSAPTVLIPPPVPASPTPADSREPIAVGYTPDPKAKGLALLLRGLGAASVSGARLLIAGIPRERALEFLARRGLQLPPGAEVVGMLPAAVVSRSARPRACVRHRCGVGGLRGRTARGARSRRGAVCAPGGGPFPGLGLARSLAPEFVAADRDAGTLARSLEAAFAADDAMLAAYRVAARSALEPYRPRALVRRLQEEVLPALLGR